MSKWQMVGASEAEDQMFDGLGRARSPREIKRQQMNKAKREIMETQAQRRSVQSAIDKLEVIIVEVQHSELSDLNKRDCTDALLSVLNIMRGN